MVSYDLVFDPTLFFNKPFHYHEYENAEKARFAADAMVEVGNLWIKNNYEEPKNLTKDTHKNILNKMILALLCEYGSNVPFFCLEPRKVTITNQKNTANTFGIEFTFDSSGIHSCIFYTDRDRSRFEDCERFNSEEVHDMVEKWCEFVSKKT